MTIPTFSVCLRCEKKENYIIKDYVANPFDQFYEGICLECKLPYTKGEVLQLKKLARFSNIETQRHWNNFNESSDTVLVQVGGTTPHCNAKVLHKPGVCWACDLYPAWQEARISWGISFTDEPIEGKFLCPSEHFKSIEKNKKPLDEEPDPQGL